MRLLLRLTLVAAVLSLAPVSAQEAAHEAKEEAHGSHGDPMIYWKWANFALLAFGLGYMLKKHAGPFFAGRTEEIRKGIDEAARLKADADARAADVEKRLASMGAEIEALKSSSRTEMEQEAARIREETAQALAKIKTQAELEIATAAKFARQELKLYVAGLAVQLAERRIQAGMTPDVQNGLVTGFVSDLDRVH